MAGDGREAAMRAGDTARTMRWERAMYWPLTIAALIYLVTYTVHVINDVSGIAALFTTSLMVVAWLLFIVDYLVRLSMARPRPAWVRSHLFDLGAVLLPAMRPVRLLDAVARMRVFTRTAGSSVRSRLLIYGVGAALLLIWYISLVVLSVERHAPGANIRSFGDAVWWAFCTVTTVGYGDYTPVTTTGRVFAVLLMIGGVVLVGMIVATFSSFMMERVTRGHEEEMPATRADVRVLYDALVAADPQTRAEAAAPPPDGAPPR